MKKLSNYISSKIDESNSSDNFYVNIESLEDGVYQGQIAGAVFNMNDTLYLCPFGVRRSTPIPCTIEIKNNKVVDKKF